MHLRRWIVVLNERVTPFSCTVHTHAATASFPRCYFNRGRFFDRRKRDALQTHLRASSVNRRTFAIVQLNDASASSLPARVVLEHHARTCAVLCRRRVVSSPLLQPRKGFFDARDHDPAASVVQMCRSRLHCHFSSRSNMRLLTKPTEACSTSDGREMPPAHRRVRFDGGVIPDVGVRVYAKSLRMGWSPVRN